MRTNIDIDDDLMRLAMRSSEATTKRGVVEEALRLLIQTRSQGSVRRLRGKVAWDGDLNASRMQRLMRLRSVASAACLREITTPSRAVPAARVKKKIVNPLRLRRVPPRNSARNSALERIRFSLPNPALRFAPTPDTLCSGTKPLTLKRPGARDRGHAAR